MRKKQSNTATTSYDKLNYADAQIIDKITLWGIRIVLQTSARQEFVRVKFNDFYSDEMAYFLDLSTYVADDTLDKREVFPILEKKLQELEQKQALTTLPTLQNNINLLKDILKLNDNECAFLEFFIYTKYYDILENFVDLLGNNLNTGQVFIALSKILNIPLRDIQNIFKRDSIFSKTSLVTILRSGTYTIKYKIDFINDSFADFMISCDDSIDNLLKSSVQACCDSNLSLDDYTHIKQDIDILVPYLQKAVAMNQKGVNVLLYGKPGTGKTELTKLLSSTVGAKLYEVNYANMDDEPIDAKKRLQAYKMAQNIFKDNVILMYDEAEDIFDKSDSLFGRKKQRDKAWINSMLETNSVPTIWITNDIASIDSAIVRRFDLSIELPIPKKSQRVKIFKQYSNDLIDEQTIQKLATHEMIAPALISRATKVVSTINSNNASKDFEHILNNTLKAQGYEEIDDNQWVSLPTSYDTKYINTNCNMEDLTKGIHKSQNARICLYGPAGTGKSAYGKYVADLIDRPLLLKKGSDLLSMWVGGTEKNIARAFEEAKDEKAVLVFDEVDSFLADRSSASKNWEITQVNEMLVQMENFDGIFIATTNLMDNLDRASLRRFDLKLEFNYLKPQQALDLFISECRQMGLRVSKSIYNDIKSIPCLTPGDFAAIKRQNRFQRIKNSEDFYNKLVEEVAIKNVYSSKRMGFIK